MFARGQRQAQGQQPGQRQGGNRAQQQPWTGGQAAPHVQLNPFDPANYAGASGTFVTANALNMADNIAGAQRRNTQNSDILRASLFRSGTREPRVRNQAHHIVESSNREGLSILSAYGIEPNSDVNGVLLPTAQPDGNPDLTTHLGSHARAYRECVNKALKAAISGEPSRDFIAKQQAIVNCLDTIRNILLTEVLPLNSRAEADYDPETDGEMTVERIFRNWGLLGE